jgi:hypothetical protein
LSARTVTCGGGFDVNHAPRSVVEPLDTPSGAT